MEEKEFIKKVKKVDSPRVHKVHKSFGVYDAYKWYRKNKPNDKKYVLTESQYFKIIRNINNALRELLILGYEVPLPERLGKLEVRKYPVLITKDGDKIKTNLPIDWNATLKLWYEDDQLFKDKYLVRVNTPELFKIFYNKSSANYNNKSYYQFSANRELKRGIKNATKENPYFDAYTLDKI